MAEPKFQLVQLFGTNDLLSIVGIKSIEAYQNMEDDVNLLRQAYLRKVIRCHPFSSGLGLDTPEGIKEAVTRAKKLYIMEDIFNLLTANKDYDLMSKKKEYFAKGTIPELPSLKYLRDNTFKGDFRDYVVPEFETVAAELKSLYIDQMKKIKEMQTSYVREDTQDNP